MARRRPLPACVAFMGCWCYFHAKGGAYARPCNAAEGCRIRYPRKARHA